MIHPPSNRRERILVYGDSGSGKSSCWVSIADWLARTGSGERVFTLDTDNAWDALRPVDGSLDAVLTVISLDEYEYGEWTPAARKFRGELTKDSWLVLDLADKAWSGAQSHFWKHLSGGDSLAEMKLRELKKPGTISGDHGKNWDVIKNFYFEFYQTVMNAPCHILLVAAEKQIVRGVTDEESVPEYVQHGAYPAGQSQMRGSVHTVLRCIEAKTGEDWRYTTIKERGPIGRPKRPYLKGEKVDDFVRTYLMKVAGWKP